jgi:hypothetical protein
MSTHSRAWLVRSILRKLFVEMGDPRNEDDAEDAPISIESATRAAKTAAALGRAPKPQATAKIGKYDLEKAIEKSREEDKKDDEAPPPSDRDRRSSP